MDYTWNVMPVCINMGHSNARCYCVVDCGVGCVKYLW